MCIHSFLFNDFNLNHLFAVFLHDRVGDIGSSNIFIGVVYRTSTNHRRAVLRFCQKKIPFLLCVGRIRILSSPSPRLLGWRGGRGNRVFARDSQPNLESLSSAKVTHRRTTSTTQYQRSTARAHVRTHWVSQSLARSVAHTHHVDIYDYSADERLGARRVRQARAISTLIV